MVPGGADIVAGSIYEADAQGIKGHKAVRWASRTFLKTLFADAPVSDPLAGLRAYRVIVLKKAFRDLTESDHLISSDGWAANVELLGRLAPHARRIAEVPLHLRYDLHARPSRFRPWRTFLGLVRLPGSMWSADVGAA